MPANNGPVVLIILDGWGIAPPGPGNAVTQANLPFFNRLCSGYPYTQLIASGEAVGLPHGENGNTEVGHINLGAGQIVYQDLPRINSAISDGTFFTNPELLSIINETNRRRSTLHLLGLIGAGGVHANNEHLFALIKLAALSQVTRLSLHLFTDGRDSPPTTARIYLNEINQHLRFHHLGMIASVSGRYYAMDRDRRWDRTEKVYRCLTEGIGLTASTPEQAVAQAYNRGVTDEFIEPTLIVDSQGQPLSLIRENDAVIFYNFRIDRPRQLTKALIMPDFEAKANELSFDPLADKYWHSHIPPQAVYPPFKRKKVFTNLSMATMTEYQPGLPVKVIMPPVHVNLPLSRIISDAGLRQLKLAETEKERFVTYYFNGLRDQPFPGEDWKIIPSPKIATYDLQPQMSTPELSRELINQLNRREYNFICINLACTDMVAHTGILPAAIQACEAVDLFLNQIIPLVLNLNGTAIITADHGNIEEIINLQSGAMDTEHSTNPVPLIIVSNAQLTQNLRLHPGILADVAPTVLQLLNLNQPDCMTGRSLL